MDSFEHIIIKKIEEDNYIINNTVTNKFVRLGKRETNYLRFLQGQGEKEHKNEIPLTDEQKVLLKDNFEKWGFLDSGLKQKRVFNVSNIVLYTLSENSSFFKILDYLQKLISPIGFILFLLSFVLILYLYGWESESLLVGISKIGVDVSSIVWVYVLSFVASVLHELSHLSACYKYTGRIGKVGIKLFYFIPAYFCDVSSIYMVSEKRKSFIVAASGVMTNHIIGALVLGLYVILYHKDIFSNACMLFYVCNLANIVFNIIPFAKFDGYWMLKALSGIDNLYDKSIYMFFDFITGNRKYIVKVKKHSKQVFQIIYGMLLFCFHWLLWVYAAYGMYYLVNDLSVMLGYILLGATCCIGLFNSIHFTKAYYSSYKKQRK